MKITIDNLRQDLLSEIEESTGEEIRGGDSIMANGSIISISDNSFARVNGRVFGSGSNLSGTLAFNVQTGDGFSIASAFASASSGNK